ncbi:hypothetical protein HYC85_031931 [Camellia sinensis]|uniref:Uncharacterized protein n=1 Tax=Camellia sinensis TaxID=4442 RepID=A0A7J7FTR2_CAMSI|nr:hypothetical protein HYC85_031931 [Camellia sinensis]
MKLLLERTLHAFSIFADTLHVAQDIELPFERTHVVYHMTRATIEPIFRPSSTFADMPHRLSDQSAKPSFFHDENRAHLFEVEPESGMLLNTDNGTPMPQVGGALRLPLKSLNKGCKVFQVITKETPNLLSRNTPIDEFPAALQGLYDTVFDVDNDKERAEAQGLEPNGFSFDGADAAGVDYAINRFSTFLLTLFAHPHREKNCRKGRFSPSKVKGKRVIELGAGCGVAGFGMALLGCDVVSTDQTEVLPLLMRNCERNASRIMQMNPGSDSFGSIQVVELSWGNVDQIKAVDPPFDYIIGTDVVYAEHLLEPLLQTMLALSGPKTTILLGYEIRSTNLFSQIICFKTI